MIHGNRYPRGMSRRALLKTLFASAIVASTACRPERTPISGDSFRYQGRQVEPVRVTPDRVIRTVVGLRPFRPSGFVVRGERLDDRVIIHNYGHGGGGMTLSWGSSHLAMEEALKTGRRSCAVLGCGALGLATARLLQRQGWEVSIYARDLPPNTTSNISGAQWSPSSVFDRARTTNAFNAQFARALKLSYRYFQDLVGESYGVRWASNYILRDTPDPPGRFLRSFPELYPETRLLSADEHPFHTDYALHYDTMFIEPPVYLNALMRDFQLAGGRIQARTFGDRREILSLTEPVIMNCTGLGSRDLFGDTELQPIKGQLTVLVPQEEVSYLMIHRGLYMFPRHDGILLGGTHERGEWSLTPDQEAISRIVSGHQKIFENMRRSA